MKPLKSIIIDTDPGHDDAIAIMLAIKSGLFEIKAITTVAGNSTIENTTRNARYLLSLLEREDIPVYSGAEKPLKQALVQAEVHGKTGLEGIDPTNPSILTNNASDKIIELVSSIENLTLVALGPLTNIAQAIQKSPEIMKKVEQMIIMGGAINVEGNKSRVAEFNLFVDPEAAEIVFNFPVKKVLVPLDVCNKIPVLLEDFEKISNQRLREPILKMMNPFIENIYKYDRKIKAALMYDPLTVYYLIRPEACKTKLYDLRIETKGELTKGMTVPELREREKKDYNVEVIESIEANLFKKDLIEILSRI